MIVNDSCILGQVIVWSYLLLPLCIECLYVGHFLSDELSCYILTIEVSNIFNVNSFSEGL